MSFVQDTFTGVDETGITAHTGEVGATWTIAYGTGTFAINTNRIYQRGGSTTAAFASGICPKADYSVTAVVRYRSGFPTIGIAARMSIINTWPSGYVALIGSGGFYLQRWQAFAQTSLAGGPYTGIARVANTDYTLKLKVRGNRISLFVNDMTTPKISVLDSNFSVTGRVGVVGPLGGSTTTGSHIDSIVADEFFPPTGYLFKGADNEWVVANAKAKAANGTWVTPSGHTDL